MKMSPWYVTTNKEELRRLGKTQEELGELQAVVARCIIQGIAEVDPSSKEINRQRLTDEIADVLTQINLLIVTYNLDYEYIEKYQEIKLQSMREWDKLVREDDFK